LTDERALPITSWPRSISWGTSRRPIAPLAPTTMTFIVYSFRHICRVSFVITSTERDEGM
jgi:hypothetical protein